jgi:hypothetical protein
LQRFGQKSSDLSSETIAADHRDMDRSHVGAEKRFGPEAIAEATGCGEQRQQQAKESQ